MTVRGAKRCSHDGRAARADSSARPSPPSRLPAPCALSSKMRHAHKKILATRLPHVLLKRSCPAYPRFNPVFDLSVHTGRGDVTEPRCQVRRTCSTRLRAVARCTRGKARPRAEASAAVAVADGSLRLIPSSNR